ncbi:mitochondrial import receptor subunit (Tom37) protein [Rutstroemia sp. NJR-2017a BBW]|nr:mitochondrial import receptor subunit (Tom37) protein [Rutstroemia sp. NJR-2017a BBW]
MVLELHTWGPAFGLPSIDAQCLATIAYMRKVIPRGQWSLVASSDPTLSPTNELPALRNDNVWIGGYRNILEYIKEYSKGKWVLDAGLRDEDAADCTAYSTFVEVHGQPLLDLSLYVSSQNYSKITRPIFNTIQPFPLPYLTPPHIRGVAKKRTEYLGLSALDLDAEGNENAREKSIIPESLRIGRQTVSSLLAASPETNAQIRLVSLATEFFEPLQELKAKKKFLVSNTQFSSLDCLAFGFMSLMLYPQLPQPWLARTMRIKFPDLCKWVEELKEDLYGGVVAVDDAMLTKTANAVQREKSRLPWQAPENGGVLNVGGAFLASLADSIPVVGQVRKDGRMRRVGGKYAPDEETGSPVWRYVATVGSVVAAVGVLAGYAFHQGLIEWPGARGKKEETTQELSDLGDAGQALFAFANQLDFEREQQKTLERNQTGPTAEVDVDVAPR